MLTQDHIDGLNACGIYPAKEYLHAMDYLPPIERRNFRAFKMACDAQPALQTTPNGGVPAFLSSFIDPEAVRILQSPMQSAKILGEQKKGEWATSTIYIPIIEQVGVTAAYGDYNDDAIADVNTAWEARQPFLYQTHMTIGDREVELAELGNINLVSEKQASCAKTLAKRGDYINHFGVAGLANYGLLNDPSLPAALTPTTKAAGGTKWVNNNQPVATAQEQYADVLMLFNQLNSATGGYINLADDLVLVYPNTVGAALGASNQFGIGFQNYVKQFMPNVEFVPDPLYATAAGNIIQLIAKKLDGQVTGYCAFGEKQRDHRIEYKSSSYLQKKSASSYGAIIRYPLAIATMIGV